LQGGEASSSAGADWMLKSLVDAFISASGTLLLVFEPQTRLDMFWNDASADSWFHIVE
jgi:hypothetical protein